MGSGVWTSRAFSDYTVKTMSMSSDDYANASFSAQDLYKARKLESVLDPMNVRRQCCDSEEHPNTVPVILGLDVTGSMGDAAVKVAQKLNGIMTNIYSDESVKDIEFCVMGIGDTYCDYAPIQISQFESDIRIAEQLDKLYFEAGGGGNSYESYTAAWYMGTYRCDLDCWKRGQKGLIITLGDELPNPVLNDRMQKFIGGQLGALETPQLLKEAQEKFNIYHISVKDRATSYEYYKNHNIDTKWKHLLGDNYRVATLNDLERVITEIVKEHYSGTNTMTENGSEVTW